MKPTSLKELYYLLISILVMIGLANIYISGSMRLLIYPTPDHRNLQYFLEEVKNDWQLHLGVTLGWIVLPIAIAIGSFILTGKLLKEGEASSENPVFESPLFIGIGGYLVIHFIFHASLPAAIFIPMYLMLYLVLCWTKRKLKKLQRQSTG